MSYAALNTVEVMSFSAEQEVYWPGAQRSIPQPIHILLVEDDASDIVLTQNALDEAHSDYELHTLRSGAQVLPYLAGHGQFYDEPRPAILMLDLSLPHKDGFEVMAELASCGRYSSLPIIILTGDSHCAFLKHSYELNIVAYLTKPCTPKKIRRALSDAAKNKG